jgi:hypothetical protein
MYPKLKINVYFIFLNIGDLTFGITLVSPLILLHFLKKIIYDPVDTG